MQQNTQFPISLSGFCKSLTYIAPSSKALYIAYYIQPYIVTVECNVFQVVKIVKVTDYTVLIVYLLPPLHGSSTLYNVHLV